MEVKMTNDEVLFVIKLDRPAYSVDVSSFIKNNMTGYTVACNTWLLMVQECCSFRAARALKSAILSYGLRECITIAQTAANILIHEEEYPLPGFTRELVQEDERVTLQCLRYLKRFTPIGADLLNDQSVQALLDLNKTRRGEPRRILLDGTPVLWSPVGPLWLLDEVKEVCYDMLSGYTNDPYCADFTNGTTSEGHKTLLDKLMTFRKFHNSFYDTPLYPIGAKAVEHKLSYVKLVPVPKNYKTSRVIAETDTVSNYYLTGVRKSIERSLKRNWIGERIHLDDQSINQEAARLGSIWKQCATIDLSGASDSISQSLADYVLPPDVLKDIREYNAQYLSYKNRKYRRHIFQTSGNPTTFVLESVIFMAICHVATGKVALFTGEQLLVPIVYGDDMIVDIRAWDTINDFLSLLGFSVNTDKSFGPDTHYRESCGVEYRFGLDLSTSFFPRKPVSDSAESLESLISLQHRIFGFTLASAWLTDFIKSKLTLHVKTITSSEIGSDCDDLWDYYPYFVTLNPPFDHQHASAAPVKREAHNILKATFNGKPLSADEESLLEMYYYTRWLRDGAPAAWLGEDLSAKIAEWNHLTKSVKDVPRDTSIPSMTWKTIKR